MPGKTVSKYDTQTRSGYQKNICIADRKIKCREEERRNQSKWRNAVSPFCGGKHLMKQRMSRMTNIVFINTKTRTKDDATGDNVESENEDGHG